MVGRTLVPGALSFSLFSMMLAVHMLYIVFIILRYAPALSILFMTLISKGCWILSKAFSVYHVTSGFFVCFWSSYIMNYIS